MCLVFPAEIRIAAPLDVLILFGVVQVVQVVSIQRLAHLFTVAINAHNPVVVLQRLPVAMARLVKCA